MDWGRSSAPRAQRGESSRVPPRALSLLGLGKLGRGARRARNVGDAKGVEGVRAEGARGPEEARSEDGLRAESVRGSGTSRDPIVRSRSTTPLRRSSGLGPTDTVDLAGADSFPASDPPPWAGTHAGTPEARPQGPELFRDLVQRLHDDVRRLAETIGERHDRSPRALENLDRAADAIEERFFDARLPVKRRRANDTAFNIEAVVRGGGRAYGQGTAAETVVVGAHYDSSRGSPGADDNATGVAVLLALARSLQRVPLARTVRLVAFAAEQPPHSGSETMGSVRYVRDIQREGPVITSMISLDSLGRYSNRIPWPLRELPILRSDLMLLGDLASRPILAQAEEAFDRANTGIRITKATFPLLFSDVRSSDHWSFAREGIPAFMVTDTAPLWASRSHGACDTADHLDFERLGLACLGVTEIVRALAGTRV